MPRELKNAHITFVSLVDKAANQRQFAIIKSEAELTFQKHVYIIKSDEDQRKVTGIVYEPDIEDSQGDQMTAKEIEKAAHQFLKDYRNIDKQHNFQSGYGDVVESYVAKSEHTIGDQVIKEGTWVMTVHVTDDDTWEAIKKEEITGFSMGGTAEVIEKDGGKVPKRNEEGNEPVTKSDEEVRGFFNVVKEFFAGKTAIQKGEIQDKFNAGKQQREFWDAFYIFEDVFYTEIWNYKPDVQRIKEAAADFAELLQQIVNAEDILKAMGPVPAKIQKAGKKISSANMDKINAALEALQALKNEVEGEEEEVKKEELQAVIKEALQPIQERLEKMEQAGGSPSTDPTTNPENTGGQTDSGTSDVAEMLQEVVKSELAPISDRLEALEKAKGIRKSIEGQDEPKQPVQKSLWSGLV